jgi:hypothetical protein
MLKPLLGIAATGVVAVLAWNLMVLVLLPMLGLALGIVAVVIKVFFILFVVMIAYWILRRMSRRDPMAA